MDAIFGTTNHVTMAQECARAVLIFAYGLVLVRMAGRRIFGQWTAIDIVVAIVTGSTLSRALTGNADLFGTLAAVALLLALHWLLSAAAARWGFLSRLFEGEPLALVRDGARQDGVLRRHGVSDSRIEQALRRAGLDSLDGARLVVLEPSGQITVLKKG